MPSATMNGGEASQAEDKTIPVAVIGMACRYPGDATSPAAFSDMLRNGRSAWSEVPKERYNIDAYYHPSNDRIGTTNAKGAHWLKEDPALFDAPFFSMTSAEAASIDPQLRILLEVAFECFDNAGVPMEKLIGSDTSAFVGSSSQEYKDIMSRDIDNIPLYAAIGTGVTMLANRLSHFYDLRGPSVALDTACSSSMVATHLGCQSIRTGESTMSLVAASQLMLLPDAPVALSRLGFLSPDGRCYTFDERANGYARGEGICVMLLKNLDEALRDGDTIRGVIRGTGSNQDGKTPGIVQPNSDAQADLIRQTYKIAGIDTRTTRYFEAHGTGTRVGDPLELNALVNTLGTKKRPADDPLYVGSVKTNIGHLEGGAGLAGLVKTILSLENGVIFPHLNFEKPNSKLPLDAWHLRVPTKLTAWPDDGLRRASVNSFGYGGSNAHCIIDDAYNYLKLRGLRGNTATVPTPPLLHGPTESDVDSGFGSEVSTPEDRPKDKHPRLFLFSSPESAAVQRLANAYATYLDEKFMKSPSAADDLLGSLAYTLSHRRSKFQWRSSLVASSSSELISALKGTINSSRLGKSPSIVYVFTGQGAQWHAMGRELLQYEIFASTVAEADNYLASELKADWRVLDELKASKDLSRIDQPKFSQPLCAIVQVGLVNLFRHWGVLPAAVVGHSSGEIAAAYAMGVLSAKDCWKCAYHRGRLSSEIRNIAPELNGAMMSVGLSEEEVQTYISKLGSSETVVVACVNSPSNITISGDSTSLAKLETQFKEENIFARRLKVENAYHSPHMQTIAEQYYDSIKDIQPQSVSPKSAPSFFSSVTGTKLEYSELNASYWVRNLVSPVQFVKALDAMLPVVQPGIRRRRRDETWVDTFIEIGPHAALQGPVRQILTKNGRQGDATYFPTLVRGKDAAVTTLETIGNLWAKGQSLDLLRVNSVFAEPEAQKCMTDLPNYPWNHTNRFWYESRDTVTHRLGSGPRLDLVGKRVDDFNPIEPQWRNLIRLSESPWLSDYKMKGSLLLPHASMLCSVIEATRQLADESKALKGFEIRDIRFNKAPVVPSEDSGIILSLRMKPFRTGVGTMGNSCLQFSFYSEQVDNIEEHCSGLVQILYSDQAGEAETDAEDAAEMEALRKRYLDIQQQCKHVVKPEDFYEAWRSRGLKWGPQFQGLTQIQATDDAACTTINVTNHQSSMPSQFEYDHLLHPTTLDSCFQSTFVPTLGDGQTREPTSIDSIFVSADLPNESGAELQGFSTLNRKGFSNFIGSAVMSDPSWKEPRIMINGLDYTTSGALGLDHVTEKKPWDVKKLVSNLYWKEDLDHVRQAEADDLFAPNSLPDTETAEACEKAAADFMQVAIDAGPVKDIAGMPPGLAHWVGWMRQYVMSMDRRALTSDSEHGAIDDSNSGSHSQSSTMDYLSQDGIDGRLVYTIGKSLSGILDGSISAQATMEKDNMLREFYSHSLGVEACNGMMAKYLELSGHKLPAQRILEVGGGTASLTECALRTLGGEHGKTPICGQYVFTDRDTACFTGAQERLKPWERYVQYQQLDIEKEPTEQGFEKGSFDVVAAGHALCATKRLDVALSNCLQLLRPGGKLVIGEFTQPRDYIHFALGACPTWWQSEDERDSGPLLNEESWKRRLATINSRNVDFVVHDTGDSRSHCSSMIVATKEATPKLCFDEVVVVQGPNASTQAETLCRNVVTNIAALGLRAEAISLEQALSTDANGKMPVSGKHVVSLLEAETPFVSTLSDILPSSESHFEGLKKLLLNSAGGLWISRGGRQIDPLGNPLFCSTTGLLRTIRNEKPETMMHELHLSSKIQLSSIDAADLVSRSLKSMFEADSLEVRAETELAELNGRLYIPRLYDEPAKNKDLDIMNDRLKFGKEPMPELQLLFQPENPLRLEIGTPGMLNTLRFVHDDLPQKPLGDSDVELAVQATGVSFSDVMIAQGLVADMELGLDASGIITKVGVGVKHAKVGDRVATFGLGTYRTLLRTHESLVTTLPDDLSFEEGASLPAAYVTAYQAIVRAGYLSRGETILIHSAAGGVGQAAVQLAKYIGAEIFVTAGTRQKRQLLIDEYGIHPDHVFDSQNLSFAKGVMRMTGGIGVDVVLNSLSGEALRRTWECISTFGRFVELAKREVMENARLGMKPFERNVSFTSVNMEHIFRHRPSLVAYMLDESFKLIRSGAVGLIKPTTVHRYSEIENAFTLMDSREHKGRIVLKAHEDDMVPVVPRNPHPLKLDANSTYLIVGGLGGIGRYITMRLVEHGAKHIAFVSRSGDAKPAAKEMMKELEDLGVNATSYKCDVADASAFATTMKHLEKEKPPLRGAIHATMVLNDTFLEDMNYREWTDTARNKIQGGWNMHKLLPKRLDFFILMSSIAPIMGNSTQSNYAAGNAFLDGLAWHRRAQGLAATAINFGFIAGIGWAAENVKISETHRDDYNLSSIHPPEVWSLIESGMTGYQHGDIPMPPQMGTCAGSGGGALKMKHVETRMHWKDPKYMYIEQLDLHGGADVVAKGKDTIQELKKALKASTSLAQATNLVEDAVAAKLARAMSMAVEDIDTARPVSVYGVDSLIVNEIRNWVFDVIRSHITMNDVLSAGSIADLAVKIAEESLLVPEEVRKERQ